MSAVSFGKCHGKCQLHHDGGSGPNGSSAWRPRLRMTSAAVLTAVSGGRAGAAAPADADAARAGAAISDRRRRLLDALEATTVACARRGRSGVCAGRLGRLSQAGMTLKLQGESRCATESLSEREEIRSCAAAAWAVKADDLETKLRDWPPRHFVHCNKKTSGVHPRL